MFWNNIIFQIGQFDYESDYDNGDDYAQPKDYDGGYYHADYLVQE